jgi:hypothetical protein
MAVLVWDATGAKTYETGVDHGVLYVMDNNGAYPLGVVWNGLTTVTQSPSGAEATPVYADNGKYLTLKSLEELGLTIEAITYPDEFEECDGSVEVEAGMLAGQQTRKKFGLVYRTRIGNDVAGDALGYKLHLVYGCFAAPSERAYTTVNDSPEAIPFSWEVSSDPTVLTGYRPTSIITIDSRTADADNLADLEDELFGTALITAHLPTPDAVMAIMAAA